MSLSSAARRRPALRAKSAKQRCSFASCRRRNARSRRNKSKVSSAGLLADTPDIRVWYVNQRGEREASISVIGTDGDKLNEAVAKIEAAMRFVPGFPMSLRQNRSTGQSFLVRPKLDQAAELGIAPETIADTLRIAPSAISARIWPSTQAATG